MNKDPRVVSNDTNGRYAAVRDIMTVPALIRIGGRKAISIHGNFAYAQRADGMTIYKKGMDEHGEYWYAWQTTVCTNF